MSLPPEPYMTVHAVERFRERVELLPPAEITAWFRATWATLCPKKWRSRDVRTQILKRKFKGARRLYVATRSPAGKPVFLALSEDNQAIATVLNLTQWIRLGAPARVTEREHIIDRLTGSLSTDTARSEEGAALEPPGAPTTDGPTV